MFDNHKRLIEAQLKLEQELRAQLLLKDQTILDLRSEIAQLRGKIDRMELILMPLSSQAGARYVASLQPPTSRQAPRLIPADSPVSSWQLHLQEHIRKMEEEDKAQASLEQERSQERGN